MKITYNATKGNPQNEQGTDSPNAVSYTHLDVYKRQHRISTNYVIRKST